MRFLTSFACTTPLITLTTARITGFSAPSTVASGAPIEIQLQGRGYIQSVQNVAVAFGIAPLDSYYPGTLGKLIGEQFLGPEKSNIIGNITAKVIVPECTPEGNATITGALFSLYGASLDGTVEYFAVNVTVGEETSREYVISDHVPVKAF